MTMTIEEAIQHCEEVAKEQENLWGICPASKNELFLCDGSKDCTTLANGKDKGCLKCAAEHRQLAKWLKDYKRLLEQEPCDDESIAKAFQIGVAFGFGEKHDKMDRVIDEILKR